ncbi:hypothetical protein COT50_03370 [candidate division WWE3 bacterium CG08_land_8_20_14_0_20_41_10]|uniref:Uncharacterized protein n=1 Tax=candidate division WWE3 bacterium CG08_land_8_20_14_0_20_41_10 TaxID=1975085 RepID=A0A2H0XBF3_UNCKA|nr:MAG: hypothetical protein COT50_03370 [candidate division WWE3 bacterium CG08_land_8_20_14_0_20_41_10]
MLASLLLFPQMKFDSKLAKLLSEFCLNVAVASFIAGFITPTAVGSISGFLLLLTKYVLIATLFLFSSWKFAKLERKTQL